MFRTNLFDITPTTRIRSGIIIYSTFGQVGQLQSSGNPAKCSHAQDSQRFCAICDTKWCAHTEYRVLLEQGENETQKDMRGSGAQEDVVMFGYVIGLNWSLFPRRSQASLKSSCGGNVLGRLLGRPWRISWQGSTAICIFEGKMNVALFVQILDRTLLPLLRDRLPEYLKFMQDNDPKHTSHLSHSFIVNNHVNW